MHSMQVQIIVPEDAKAGDIIRTSQNGFPFIVIVRDRYIGTTITLPYDFDARSIFRNTMITEGQLPLGDWNDDSNLLTIRPFPNSWIDDISLCRM